MKIWEINLEEGRQYRVVGESDKCFKEKVFTADRFGELNTQDNRAISKLGTLQELLALEFEEVVDWHKIPVDTKVLVSHNGESWCKRHFKLFKNNSYVCFSAGQTSWTVDDDTIQICEWEYCKLAEE